MSLFRRDRPAPGPRTLGAYTLVEELGHGGMGEVWRAKHRSLLRPAAVKLMGRAAPRDAQETMRRRFEREVQATALLTSPHTVAVYDFGQADDGTLYYVMELLTGLDIETLVSSFGPQPADRVAALLRQVAQSLDEAHHRGLVHRDIKPANLHVCAVGMELDFVKVLDFGLVFDAAHDPHETAPQLVSGTPAYLAPESAAQRRYDARSDLYALGCVAYWLLTGRTVFTAETGAAMIAAHLHEPPTPPSQLTELAIPPAFEQLVLALLAKDPDARPSTAAELIRLLDLHPHAWTQHRADAWWRANVPDLLARSRTPCRGGIEDAPR